MSPRVRWSNCCAVLMVLGSGSARAQFPSPEPGRVDNDSRDHYSLLDQHLVNRQLFEQLDAPDQSWRLGSRWDRFAVAADTAIATQQTFGDSEQSRFHGYFLADVFAAAQIVDGLDANLNLLMLNPSSSDGYRVSSQLYAGLALHGGYDLFRVSDEPLRLEVYGLDLDRVTVGQGLLVERWPMEAEIATLRWGDYYLRQMFSGRAFWPDDDLLTLELGAFDGNVELLAGYWKRGERVVPAADLAGGSSSDQDTAEAGAAYYAGAAFNWPIWAGARLAGEYDLRLRGQVRSALMLRSDYSYQEEGPLRFHLGYQFRWYQDGFGPRDRVEATSSSFNVPENEDVYVTNSFEYFGLSEAFEQWSHTVMAEVQLAFTANWGIFAEAESWTRSARNAGVSERVVYTTTGQRFPGTEHRLFYRTGLRVHPWTGLPHRVNLFYTNKQVLSQEQITDAVTERFDRGRYVTLELEAFL